MQFCLSVWCSVFRATVCVTICAVFLPTVCVGEDEKAAAPSVTPEQRAFVQNKVLPLLEARCFECHGGSDQEVEGGLVLTRLDAAVTGGDSGPAIVPGKPNESLLVEAIRYESFEMPPRSKMPDAEIAILVDWISMGAPWPADLQHAETTPPAAEAFPLEERRAEHWAWQQITDPTPPDVRESEWPADPLDQFILARLEEAGLQPAPDADRTTLIRRLYFDLIGLPPAIDDINSYVADPADDLTATATVVDRLLESPQYGERWARHWLDLVRYAETLGHEFDYPLRHAWQYRDYVIRAFNADVPYNDFIREHVAGDLMTEPRRHPAKQFNESLIGTGFWHLHEGKHSPVDVVAEHAVTVDNQIDVFARTFMGLTVACARCHDHKFDAIATSDYYGLYGILNSSRRRLGWLDSGRRIEKATAALRDLRQQGDELLDELRQDDLSTGVTVSLVTAAMEVFRGTPADGEQSDPELPGTRRSVQAVAQQFDCDADQLRGWVQRLADPQTQQLSSPLSLTARVARSSDTNDVAEVVKRWSREVLNAATDDGQTVLYADFSDGLPDGWSVTGPAFESARRHSAASLTATPPALAGAGLSSADLSRRFCGSLFSPQFEISHPEILIRVAGEKTRVRLVIDGYVMMEFNELLFKGTHHKLETKGEFRWLRLAQDVHRYLGRSAYLEFQDEGDGWFVVDEVRFATKAGAEPPAVDVVSSNRELAELLKTQPSVDPLEATIRTAWSSLFADGLPACTSDVCWTGLRKQWQEVSENAPRPVPVIATTEGAGEDVNVFIRGNHRNQGETAVRSFLNAVSGNDQAPVESGSGRLELANRLLASDNPFPARVAVNRLWHHLFGRGIVATTDDFGVLGARPTHPQLLDHLATRFKQDGWSVKRMIRTLVLSKAYRMQSSGSASAREQDPANQLLHAARVRRLQGEAIRDTMLMLAGRLDLASFGAPVPVALTPFMQGRGRPKGGPLDGNGRRSIYISVNRNFLSPFMLAFDTPAPVTTRGRRSMSNVPAQALIMLNDEFAHQQAERWADILLTDAGDVSSVVTHGWQQALGRMPSESEQTAIRHFSEQQAALHDETLSDSEIGRQTLKDVCHAIMNTKEFLYIR